jgi:hypothetical protein
MLANKSIAKINDDNQHVHSLPPFANETNKNLSQNVIFYNADKVARKAFG